MTLRLLLLLSLLLITSGCSQGVRRDLGFTPRCLEERVWNDAKGVVEMRPLCVEPNFYRRLTGRDEQPQR